MHSSHGEPERARKGPKGPDEASCKYFQKHKNNEKFAMILSKNLDFWENGIIFILKLKRKTQNSRKKLNVSEDLCSPTLPSDVKKKEPDNLKGDWELCRQARKGPGFPVVPGHFWVNSANAVSLRHVRIQVLLSQS